MYTFRQMVDNENYFFTSKKVYIENTLVVGPTPKLWNASVLFTQIQVILG